jgi:hypothetical protein
MTESRTPQVQAETRGAVPHGAVSFAVDRVSSLLQMASEPVLFARVKLSMAADPAVQRPAVAQVNIDLNGRLIRAQAAGVTLREAAERACDRVRIRLERAARNWAAIRGTRPVMQPGEWRHQSLPSVPLPYYPRPPQDRAVMRRTSYAPVHKTPDEAVADAELLGYDFHLFTEKSTGEDSVVYRAGDGYRLTLAHQRARRLGPVSPSINVSTTPAPRLTVGGATNRLEAAEQTFLFFVNSLTGRGNLIYHRYDGHYGLIEPAG